MKNSVQTFLIIALVFLSSIYFISSMVSYEKDIEHLEEVIEIKVHNVDSLILKIDSLSKELKKYDVEYQLEKYKNKFINLLDAMIHVESSDNDSAYHSGEDAVGCLQIRQCMVNDVNRILRRHGKIKRYTYDDRWCRDKSIEMFNIFVNHYNLTSAEEIARCWNGGPRGINNMNTVGYWNKVKSELEEINS